jgi:hypothetical protein
MSEQAVMAGLVTFAEQRAIKRQHSNRPALTNVGNSPRSSSRPMTRGVSRFRLEPYPRPGFSTAAVHTPARVNVTCVTPLGEEVASTS